MRTTLRLFLLSIMVLILAPFAALAADAPPGADVVSAWFQPILDALTGKYSWVITVLTIIGILRLVFKPVMTIIETVVANTPSTKDDEFLAKWEASASYRWLLWGLDWLGSIKVPAAMRTGLGTTNPASVSPPPAPKEEKKAPAITPD